MPDRQAYASQSAITQSREMGLHFSHAVWCSAFLAITDSLLGEQSAIGVTARLRGPVRDGRERWSLVFPKLTVDCLYDPSTAMIVGLIPPREAEPVASSPVPRPRMTVETV